ncbi:CAP domain-containing protein [Flavobacterium sp.]|uniref:CAP domain-containing protein n=1 Tax=Flavobacterium sp. TaxID=239 RepID=UPI00261FF237|nr:CAP domain-containing protein [Flavobacterium sp.]
MNSSTFKFSAIFAAVTAALMVSACGGGGGGSSDSGSANNGGGNNGGGGNVSTCSNGASDYPACTQLPLQTAVPAATYPANSIELQAFTELNAVRQKLGLGLLAQNTQLDLAAKNHANYISLNYLRDASVFGHSENSNYSGFTGNSPGDRGKYAGFTSGVGEVIASTNTQSNLTPTYDLLNTVSHAQGLLDQCSTKVGISYAPLLANGTIINPVVYNYGALSNSQGFTLCQRNGDSFTYTYPFDGQLNIATSMAGEVPNPIPDLPKDQFGGNDWINGTSAPIIIGFEKSKSIDSISATVTEIPSNAILPMRLLWWNSVTYPNPYKDKYIAFLVGFKPFKSQTKYQVSYTATVGGNNVTKQFSFTTK